MHWLFQDKEGPYHIETSQLICSANQWTGFYMIATSIIKELNSDDQLRSVLCQVIVPGWQKNWNGKENQAESDKPFYSNG